MIKKVIGIFFILSLFILFQASALPAYESAADDFDELHAAFIDPPNSSRPGAFWCWLNGDISKEAVSRDLREMSEKGMGRAEIWDVAAVRNPDNMIPAGPAFLSDSSVAMIKYAFNEGKKYGLKIGMIGSSGWNAGGAWVEPDWASKQLFYSVRRVRGPLKSRIDLPFPDVPEQCPKGPDGMPVYHKEVAVLAFPDNSHKKLGGTNQIMDLTGKLTAGSVPVDLPAGDWIIMRFICSNNGQRLIVPSPNSNGLFIDFFDPNSTRRHLRHIVERLGIKPGADRESGLAYIEFDSMELAEGIPWTDSMPGIFKKWRGYDLLRYLPVLAGWTIDGESERFLYDWKKTISDQFIFSHYDTGRKFLKQYNVDLVAEAGGPGPPTWDTCPVDALKALGHVTVPRGEFWVQHRNIFLVKEIASASHIYGQNIVDAESFTTWRRWKDSPFDLKKLADRAFCEGLNCVTFHTFASTRPEDGLPGRTYHAGSDINHANTWWNKSKPFMDYLARCSLMLRQGLFAADACYYYGDKAPNFFPAYHDVPQKPVPEDLGKGYDYDVINSDVILNRMSVVNGRITLPDGLSYSLMVLPDQDDIPLNVLRKLETLVQNGATIIGREPVTVPGLKDYSEKNAELSKTAGRMWVGIDGARVKVNHCGKGRVIWGLTAREVLSADGIGPDLTHDSPFVLDYIHRHSREFDIYFIRNTSGKSYSGECAFRVTGKFPELWDPSTGERTGAGPFTDEGGRIHIQLELEPHASVFVVFSENKQSLEAKRESVIVKSMPIDGSWRVTFPEGWGAPAETFFDRLMSWTDSSDDGVRYFSGTACYHKTISVKVDVTAHSRIELSLGEVYDVAEVYLNGQSSGIAWKPPYKLDVTALIQTGENELKIEVMNQWVNRLTGDMLSGPDDRFCRTNQPYITSDDMGYDNWAEGGDETFRVQTSGLLGPVSLIFVSDEK